MADIKVFPSEIEGIAVTDDDPRLSALTKAEVEAVLTGEIASHTHAGGGGYVHPATHSADMIVDGVTNKAYTGTEQTKLAGIEAGAQVNEVSALDLSTGLAGKVDTTDGRLSDARTPTAHSHAGVYEPENPNIQAHVAQIHAPFNAQANADITKAEIEAKLIGEIGTHTHAGGGGGNPLDAWPVGSVFITVVNTSPATLLGGGTWAAFGAGRMLIGRDAGDVDFDTAEETGGAKTSNALIAHTHGQLAPTSASGGALRFAVDTNASGSVASGLNTASAGSGSSFSLMNPYIVVYMYKRTA